MPPRPMTESHSFIMSSNVGYGKIHDESSLYENVYVNGQTELNPTSIKQSTERVENWFKSNSIVKQVYPQAIRIILGSLVAWIPGLTAILCYGALKYPLYAYPTCFGVGLFWWSVWLCVSWVGMWFCWLAAYAAPIILRLSLGVLAINFKRQIGYLEILQKYVATFLWSILIWATYLTIVWLNFPGHQGVDSSLLDPLASGTPTGNSTATSSDSNSILNSLWGTSSSSSSAAAQQAANELANYSDNTNWLITFSRFFFGIALCSALLLAQKLCIQSIANDFHEVTYSDRIELAKYHTTVLTTLYSHVKHVSMNMVKGLLAEKGELQDQLSGLRSGKNVKWAHYRNTLSLQGKPKPTIISTNNAANKNDLASPPLTFTNPFSPEVIVEMSLENVQETRKLARLLFDTFAVSLPVTLKHGVNRANQEKGWTLPSFERLFPTKEQAIRAFAMFDRDENGDCTWEEVLTVCMDVHKERMSLLASMHDIDAAVARLDQITKGVWATMSCVIVAALLSVRFSTLIASLGTILLGLSWLISSTAQESLSSIVWVFCKHPIDVGDLVVVPGLLSFASSSTTKDTIAALQGYTDGDTFEVEEVQLMSTILKTTTTSKNVQVSNYLLAQKPLVNLRRSGPIEEPFTLSVQYDTALESVEKLRLDMCDWLEGQGRDFRFGMDIMIDGLDDQSLLKLTMLIRYKSNWQDARLRVLRRNRWISALKQLLEKHDIHGPAYTSSSPSTFTPPSKQIKMYHLMDVGKDDDELVYDDDTVSSQSYPSTAMPTIRSRLNEAMPPITTKPNMFTRHSASTRQMEAINVEGRHRGMNDLESQQ